MSKRFEKLGAEVARIQDESLADERSRARVRRRLLETPALPKARSRGWRLALALTAVGVAVLVVWTLYPSASKPIAYRVDLGEESREVDLPIAAPLARPVPVRFTDGSAVQLAPGTRARVTELTSEGATVQLDHGEATVSVRHRKTTRWSVRAGPFLVRVTGTRFRVDWSPQDQSFELQVFEGEVRVTGPDTPDRVVRGGAEMRVGPRAEAPSETAVPAAEPLPTRPEPATPPQTREVERNTSSARPSASELKLKLPPKRPESEASGATGAQPQTLEPEAATPEAEPSSTEGPTEEPAPPSEPWKIFFKRGDYEQALVELTPEDIERALWQADSAQLMELGAAARRANDRRAGYIYSVVRSRFARARASADAAFMLARMYFHTGAPQTAATWLETYLREQPDGRFAREASGRLVEAYQQAADIDRARVAAERYLARYPEGPHAKLARSVLE